MFLVLLPLAIAQLILKGSPRWRIATGFKGKSELLIGVILRGIGLTPLPFPVSTSVLVDN